MGEGGVRVVGRGALLGLCVLPQRVQRFDAQPLDRLPPLGRQRLDPPEAALEALVGLAQRRLGVDAEVAGEVDGGEQEVAQLGRDRRRVAPLALDLVRNPGRRRSRPDRTMLTLVAG
jgi:hypothetical protein